MKNYPVFILILGLLLTSCGGGGGGGSEPSAPAPQNITVSLTSSADSAEVNSSITLTWSSTLATSCSASGAWSGSKGTTGSESITIGVGGSNTFSLSCSATGANSGSASTTVNGLRYFDGKVFDGYIRGAEVFVDTNDNLILDANEASVTTDNQGSFNNLLFGNGTLVARGGIDLDTGAELSDLTLVHKLEGYEASKLASPFTTLIAYMSDASNINAALGIDASINLLTTDPIPNLGEGIYDQMYEKGNQLTVLSYTLQNQATADSSQLYFEAIADQLEESYASNQTAVDIEDPTFISNVIDKAETASANTLTPEVKANLNTVLATTIPLLKVYADSNTTASVQRFAFSTLQNDVQDSTVIGSSSSATINQYENNVFGYVATDQGIDEGTINPISNNAPTISSSATFSAAENQTAIGTISASDADGDSLTYSISGSEINISSSGVLTFATAPDYETKTSYSATVTVSDGTDSVTQAITVSITDVDETAPNEVPVISSSATFSAAENQTAIGSVTATDADGDSLTYSISGSEINISSSGVLTFATAPDYETKTSYSATVTVSDGTDSVTQAITVTITDVDETAPNEVPVISSSATFSAAENQTAIGSVTATDADGDSLTYSISGSEINISSSGVLTFATAPDYETKTSYSATVTVSDGTDSVTQAITVTITDVDETAPNEVPVISSSATFSAAENQTAIGSVTATDADGDSLTYSISGSEINISSSGVLTFATAPDYETKTSYSATVTVSDGTDSVTQAITVTITDVDETESNEAPTLSINSNYSVNEDVNGICQGGPAIGDGNCPVFNILASDPEGEDLFYTISGPDAAAFQVSSAGAVNTTFGPNYEVPIDENNDGDYQITITVSDGNLSVSQAITITVTNINEAPFISDYCFDSDVLAGCDDIYVDENQTSALQINALDPENQTISYSFYNDSGNDDNSYFNISSSGAVTFKTTPDYETKNSYALYFALTDSDGLSAGSYQYNIRLNNLNDNTPVISSSATFSAAENQTAIGSISASDADGDSLTYSISGSEINISSSGVLTFATAPDYETKNSYTATVTVSDGTNAVTQDITINITDVDEAPTITSSSTFTIAENQTSVGSATATDPENQSLTYAIYSLPAPLAGEQYSGGSINSSTGAITLNGTGFNYEERTSITAQVEVSDGTNAVTQDITINITDVDEAPTITSSSTFTIAENQTSVGSVTATDPENQSLTYAIYSLPAPLAGEQYSGGSINPSTGAITLNGTGFNYEERTSITAQVEVSDGTNAVTQDITINITDVDEAAPNTAPTISSSATFSAAENQTAIGSVTATDADGDSLTYSVSGSEINISSSGVLTFATAPDYETKNSYTATVTVSDGTASTTQDITVNINDISEVAASINLTVSAIKTFTFSWTDTSDATSYNLLEDPDGSSGYSNLVNDIAVGTESYTHIVPLHKRINASYILQSCYNSTCVNSSPVNVSGNLENAIGYLKASNTDDDNDYFGGSVSLSNDGSTLAVGAQGEESGATGVNGDQSDNSIYGAGAVYVFVRSGSTWSQQAYIKSPSPAFREDFGYSVSLSSNGDTLAIGALNESSGAIGINGDDTDQSKIGAGAAYIFTRSGTTWSQEAYIKSSTSNTDSFGNSQDYFGAGVDLSNDGNTLLVIAISEGSNATGINGDETNNDAPGSGAVYVFTRSGTTWSQEAYIKSSNTETGDALRGASLSGDGDTIAVGATGEDSSATGINGDQTNNDAPGSGAVYVFTRSGTTWSQEAYIKSSNSETGDAFGGSIDLSSDGNTMVVSAVNEDSSATGINGDQTDNSISLAGAAYVFTRSGTAWSQEAYIKASLTGDINESFGDSVQVSGDGNTLVVGTQQEDSNAIGINGDQTNNSKETSGAAYAFTRSGSTWSQIAYIKASNTDDSDRFGGFGFVNSGISMSNNGDILVIGAYSEESNATGIGGDQTNNTGNYSGAVYIY